MLLLEMWELLQQDARARPLASLDDLADVLMRPIAQEHVDMIARHLARDDVKVVLQVSQRRPALTEKLIGRPEPELCCGPTPRQRRYPEGAAQVHRGHGKT